MIAWMMVFLAALSYAQIPDMCNVENPKPLKTIKPRRPPDYFFKTSPDGKYIYYTSAKKTYRIDTETGAEIQTPGQEDVVPTPDHKFLTYLGNKRILHITPINEDATFDSNRTVKDISRTYQSMGIQGESYRLFSMDIDPDAKAFDKKGWSYFDFGLEDGKIKIKSPAKFAHNSTNYKLAMINKTGDTFAAFNKKTEKTEILDLATGKVKDKLPLSTGKADFSYDDKKLTFHVTSNITAYDLNENWVRAQSNPKTLVLETFSPMTVRQKL